MMSKDWTGDELIELINGDSREFFNGVIAKYRHKRIICVSDPPFNIGYKYNTYNDRQDESEYYEMLAEFFGGGLCSVVVHYPEALYKLAFQIGKFPDRVISWCYNTNTGKQHRDIAFFGIKPDMSKVRQPYKNPTDKRIIERMKNGSEGAKLYDWWLIDQVKNVSAEKTEHPCQMPLDVMNRVVGILPEDCIIIDPFMGSGTTGVAVRTMNAKQSVNRGFVGIEIDEKYYAIAKERIYNAPTQLSLF